jgi:hypothetical protein
MKRIMTISAVIATTLIAYMIGYLQGNRTATFQCHDRERAIADTIYNHLFVQKTMDDPRRQDFVRTMTAAIALGPTEEDLNLLDHPWKVYTPMRHSCSHTPLGSRAGAKEYLEGVKVEWEDRKKVPNQQIQPIAGKPGSG